MGNKVDMQEVNGLSSIRQSEGWSTTKEIAGNLSNISTIKRGIGGFGKTLGGVFN